MADSSLNNLPEVGAGDYLIEILFDIGPVCSNGMGAVPISEQEIAAWQFNRQTRLKAWECQYLRELSREYASMLHSGTDMHCPPPYAGAQRNDENQKKRVQNAFKNLAKTQRKG